ncbi:MAG: protein kinase [Deltaproteobacteria bacterium]|nr:protein kinase [Deltaproteobacteria bacterium]
MILSGKYEVTEKVGQGGMGIVYRVRHLDLDTVLALKILPRDLSQDAELVERFRREARVMARLNHRNIVRVYDFAKDGDTYYLIMEFLQGKNLHQYLQHSMRAMQRPLPLPEVLQLGVQIAEALAYGHEQAPAVVHRDIKPSNIIVEEDTARAVVTDFGIAKLMGETQSDLTRSGLFVGTPKYCAPEQLRHDDDLDARVDIYSLGMVLYELYTGRQFFAGLKDHEVIGRVLYEKVENSVSLPDAPSDFTRVVERAIARDRDARYPTAASFAADLQACLGLVGGKAKGADAAVPSGDETNVGDMGAIDAQIRALERKRLHRQTRQTQIQCREARTGAESAGAAEEAATEFGRARTREAEAEERLTHNDHQSAAALFREAAAAFESAMTLARERRQVRVIEEAREAMQVSAGRATAAGAAELARELLERAERLSAEAEESATRREYEAAATGFRQATQAYDAASDASERVLQLRALEAEIASVVAARTQAESVEAALLVPELFASAVRDHERLERTRAAGEVMMARELLVRVRDAFVAAASAAVEARERRATAVARERMTVAGDAARAAGAADLATEEIAAATAVAVEGARADGASDWEQAQRLFTDAAERYEKARELALSRGEQQRVRRELAEARKAMEAARNAAEHAGAPEAAATVFGRADEFAAHAAAAAADDPAQAASEYRRAADQYAQSTEVAERRAQRRVVEAKVADIAAARAAAVAVGAQDSPAFRSAATAEAEAREALGADDLSVSNVAAERALVEYREAGAASERAQHSRDADQALARVTARQAEALEVGADRAAVDTYAAAKRLHAEATERREREDWQDAIAHAAKAEERFTQSIHTALEALRKEVATAREAAEQAGGNLAEGNEAERVAAERVTAGASVAAAAALREAAEHHRAAVTERRGASEDAQEAALAAQRDATGAETPRLAPDLFAAASRSMAIAEEVYRAERFDDAAIAFAKSARVFAEAKAAADRAQSREHALASRGRAAEMRMQAERAGAVELVGEHDLQAAARIFADAEGALADENFAAADAGFGAAASAFAQLLASSERARAEYDARAAAERARTARSLWGSAPRGLRARWRVRRADRLLEHGMVALDAGDLARASADFEGATALLDSPPPTALASPAAPPAATTIVSHGTPAAVIAEPATVVARGASATLVVGDVMTGATAVPDAAGAPTIVGNVSLEDTALGEAGGEAARLRAPWRARQGASRRRPPRAAALAAGSGVLVAVALLALGLATRLRTTVVPTHDVPAARSEKNPAQEAQVEKAPKTAPKKIDEVAVIDTAPAVPTVVPPPPPPAPRIQSVEPEEAVVRLQQGESASFGIQVADARGVSYRWSVGDRVLTDASGPTVTVPVENDPQQITVVARTAGGEATHSWKLASLPRATAVSPPRPPIIEASLPADRAVELEAGSRRQFAVTAKDPSGGRLSYAWSIDGRPVGRDSPTFDFTPGAAEEGEVRHVKVQIASATHQTAATEWIVTVPQTAVRIVNRSPGGDVAATIGEQQDFVVEARAGARDAAPLSYRWSVNGQAVPNASGPRLAYKLDRSLADVQVSVEAPGRQAAVSRWRIRGESVPTPKIDARATAQREIEQWIEAYRKAYQDKNVDSLIALGVVPANQRGKMAQILDDLQDLEVRIASRTIDVQGDDSATVTLTRIDGFRTGGSRTEKTIAIKKTLRKRNGAWVAQ